MTQTNNTELLGLLLWFGHHMGMKSDDSPSIGELQRWFLAFQNKLSDAYETIAVTETERDYHKEIKNEYKLALEHIAKLDYSHAATNMAAYDAVKIARAALAYGKKED